MIMDMSEQTLDAPLPFTAGRKWHIALDTAFDSLRDINPLDVQSQHAGAYYLSQPRSIAVLEAR
jgi:isoamylase